MQPACIITSRRRKQNFMPRSDDGQTVGTMTRWKGEDTFLTCTRIHNLHVLGFLTMASLTSSTTGTELASPPDTSGPPFCEVQVKASADKVWSKMTMDVTAWPSFVEAIDKIAIINEKEITSETKDKSVHVGLKFDETRNFGGRQETQTMDVTYADAASYTYVLTILSCGCHFEFVNKVVPTDDSSCKLQIYQKVDFVTFLAKYVLRWMSYFTEGWMKKHTLKDLEDIKAAVEDAEK